jgi:hypothetical protein
MTHLQLQFSMVAPRKVSQLDDMGLYLSRLHSGHTGGSFEHAHGLIVSHM